MEEYSPLGIKIFTRRGLNQEIYPYHESLLIVLCEVDHFLILIADLVFKNMLFAWDEGTWDSRGTLEQIYRYLAQTEAWEQKSWHTELQLLPVNRCEDLGEFLYQVRKALECSRYVYLYPWKLSTALRPPLLCCFHLVELVCVPQLLLPSLEQT